MHTTNGKVHTHETHTESRREFGSDDAHGINIDPRTVEAIARAVALVLRDRSIAERSAAGEINTRPFASETHDAFRSFEGRRDVMIDEPTVIARAVVDALRTLGMMSRARVTPGDLDTRGREARFGRAVRTERADGAREIVLRTGETESLPTWSLSSMTSLCLENIGNHPVQVTLSAQQAMENFMLMPGEMTTLRRSWGGAPVQVANVSTRQDGVVGVRVW